MKIVEFVLWTIAGALVMVTGPTTLTYGFCWGTLMIHLILDIVKEIMEQ